MGRRTWLPVVCSLSAFQRCVAAQNETSRTTQPILENLDQSPRSWIPRNVSTSAWDAAFASPNMSHEVAFTGYDITQPYPGTPLDGWKGHLRIATDVPMMEAEGGNTTGGQFTTLTHLYWTMPDEIRGDDGLPKALGQGWGLCAHYYWTSRANATDDVENCGLLSEQCRKDLSESYIRNETRPAPGSPMSWFRNMLCPSKPDLPASCKAIEGAEHIPMGLHPAFLANSPMFSDADKFGFRAGSGANEKGNLTAYDIAANRTWVVAWVWGHLPSPPSRNQGDDEQEGEETGLDATGTPPNVTFACFRGSKGVANGSRNPANASGAANNSDSGARQLSVYSALWACALVMAAIWSL